MKNTTFIPEFKKLFSLALPIIAGGVLSSIIPFINTVFMGHVSNDALAASGLVNAIFVFVMVLFWGIFSSLSALIARYEASKNPERSRQLTRSAFVLAICLSLPVMLLFDCGNMLLELLGQKPHVIALAHPYFISLSFAVLPDFLLAIFYQLYFGLSKPRIVMILMIIMVPLDLGLTGSFVFGWFGLPALGIVGLGIGASLSYWALLGIMILVTKRYTPFFKNYLSGKVWFFKDCAKELLHVGLPVGTMWVFECGFFTAINFFMGVLSDTALAAHQMTFQTYIFFFMFTYNFCQAVSIRVGDAVGKNNFRQARDAYLGGLLFSCSISFFVAALCWFAGGPIIHFFLGNAYFTSTALVSLTLILLKIAPIAFLADSLGYNTFATLRALKDTRYTMLVALVVYWILVVPGVAVGVIHFHWQNPAILWWMMCLGLFFSFIGQVQRLFRAHPLFLIR